MTRKKPKKKKPFVPIDWSEAEAKARKEMNKNRDAIESGETFRAHQKSSRKSPGQDKGNKF